MLLPSPSLYAASCKTRIRLAEILSALTFALDATEGAMPGHSLRCCLLGMRLARALGLPQDQRSSLYYALQLKDAGCSSNAARMSAMMGGGNDHKLKHAFKLNDWTRQNRPSPRYLRELWRQCLPGASVLDRLRHLSHLANNPENNTQSMISLRCERGASIALRLNLGADAAEAVRNLDEHWDGSGFPDGKRGTQIPILARICAVAQHLDIFAAAKGPERALSILAAQRSGWYDPELIRLARSLNKSRALWIHCLPEDKVETTRRAVLALDPGTETDLDETHIDQICEAFANIVDAKSPFTFRHSIGVMQVACAMAEELGFSPVERHEIRRAALLHDLGKLAVPNSILDKTSKLTENEWRIVRQHPVVSATILRRVRGFERIATLAEQHHERLDGTGYPNRQRAEDLSVAARLIAVADCYAAMAENRPYRRGFGREIVLERLSQELDGKLDALCFAALEASAPHWPGDFPEAAEEAHPVATAGFPSMEASFLHHSPEVAAAAFM